MNKKWVILCSTAIAAVYTAGYITTEAQVSFADSPNQSQVNIQLNTTQRGVAANPTAIQHQVTKPSAILPSANVSDNTPAASQYKDGTYTGMGINRRGSIQVNVTIAKDKITDVEVSDFAMHYSEQDIVGLPDEVIQTQNALVKNVTGATYSTQAFTDAIQDALSQAENG